MTLGEWLDMQDPYYLILVGWILGALSMLGIMMLLVLWGQV